MSVVQPTAMHDRGVSPLMSNNPFRNKIQPAVSPESAPRPVSTNPFLDTTELDSMTSGTPNYNAVVTNGAVDKAADVFSSMDIGDKQNELQKTRSRQANIGPRRPDQPSTQAPSRPPGHRSTTSEQEKKRQQILRAEQLDIFADPVFESKPRDRERRPRRNSESSLMDKHSMDPEEERRRRERKYRETKRSGSKSTKPSKKLDVIDKLDVTSIYGTGLFHHDGPFDACNPHRNRKREKYAPMQAFPKDSTNMVMGGSGPVNKTLDYNKFHGYGQEAHRDFNEAAIAEETPEVYRRPQQPDGTPGYNPTAQDVLHGDESVGLGTSTFLEGAPASRIAIQRRESEYDPQAQEERPGLGRKKSLAQKIRGVRPGRDRYTSPEGRDGPASPPILTGRSDNVANPFFRGYEGEQKRENTAITIDEPPKPTRMRAPSSPKRAELERRYTNESASAQEPPEPKPTGLLGRMKSLKGGRRPVRRDTNS